MLKPQQVEELICLISAMDRETLIGQFQSYRACFPLDFSEEFLHATSLDRLQHIFVAVCLQCGRMPSGDKMISAA